MKLDEMVAELEIDISNTAEWRRIKALEHPDDNRNIEAAELLDRLAATVRQTDPAVLEAYRELFEDVYDSERHGDLLRSIGFHWWPKTATEFVSRFISEETGA